jgi:uncharacterized membrane protein (DUF373 family)
MVERRPVTGGPSLRTDRLVTWVIVVIEYAIVISLLLVAGVVLVRTVVTFFRHWSVFPESVVSAIDGILVVIILLDLLNTVFRHMRSSDFPVRPFLVIGILAGVREILSSSARLTLSRTLSNSMFHDTIITLSIGVGMVVFLLIGLFILGAAERRLPPDD